MLIRAKTAKQTSQLKSCICDKSVGGLNRRKNEIAKGIADAAIKGWRRPHLV